MFFPVIRVRTRTCVCIKIFQTQSINIKDLKINQMPTKSTICQQNEAVFITKSTIFPQNAFEYSWNVIQNAFRPFQTKILHEEVLWTQNL